MFSTLSGILGWSFGARRQTLLVENVSFILYKSSWTTQHYLSKTWPRLNPTDWKSRNLLKWDQWMAHSGLSCPHMVSLRATTITTKQTRPSIHYEHLWDLLTLINGVIPWFNEGLEHTEGEEKKKKRNPYHLFSLWRDQEDSNMGDPGSIKVKDQSVVFRIYNCISYFFVVTVTTILCQNTSGKEALFWLMVSEGLIWSYLRGIR